MNITETGHLKDFQISIHALIDHNDDYLTVKLQGDKCYNGKYSLNYIETMTKKTGNFKRFSVFVEMILSALRQTSKTVSLDLLTGNDLQLNNNKLYLILTYAIAFDRIHYPLPLIEEESLFVKLSKENDKLKHELKQRNKIYARLPLMQSICNDIRKVVVKEHAYKKVDFLLCKLENLFEDEIEPSFIKPKLEKRKSTEKRKPIQSSERLKSSSSMERSKQSLKKPSQSLERKPKKSTKRFDPTEYIREKERKLQERRESSRSSSRQSIQSFGSDYSKSSIASTYSKNSIKGSASHSKKKSNLIKKKPRKFQSDVESDFEERLEKLKLYLMETRL